jgi:hypothetical protein
LEATTADVPLLQSPQCLNKLLAFAFAQYSCTF